MDAAGITNVSGLGAGGSNRRERFQVDLKPDQTNIVSLKKLRREAGEIVSDDSSSDENEAEKYIFVKLPRKKRSGARAIRDTVQPSTGKIKHSEPSNYQTKSERKELKDPVAEEDDVQMDTKSKNKGKKISSSLPRTGNLKFQKEKSAQHELYARSSRCKNLEGFL